MVSSEEEAVSLIKDLNLNYIFPPKLNNPKSFISSSLTNNSGTTRPKRPPNAFIICRQNVIHQARQRGVRNMRVISKAASMLWHNANEADQRIYQSLAAQVAELHREKFPNFQYTPPRPGHVFRSQATLLPTFNSCSRNSPHRSPYPVRVRDHHTLCEHPPSMQRCAFDFDGMLLEEIPIQKNKQGMKFAEACLLSPLEFLLGFQ